MTDTHQTSDRKIAHEEIYTRLFNAIITGGFEPGKAVTLRGLAEELGCSPMPVREAVRRLVALGALDMRSTRRITVAPMTRGRFDEIWKARELLEPEIAARALPLVDQKLIDELVEIDNQIETAMNSGDQDAYSYKNWEFHFTLYRAANCGVLIRLIESVWLQFGPFMRLVIGRLGPSLSVDHHHSTIEALKAGDEAALREAIRLDIKDGMERIEVDVT